MVKLAASAGCGKTFSIERTITDLLISGVSPTAIMFVIFNRKPALEFRTNIRVKHPTLTDKDIIWWNTHHSINARLISASSLFGKMTNMGDKGKLWDQFAEQHGYYFGEEEGGEISYGEKLRGEVSKKIYEGYDIEDMEEDEQYFLSRLRAFEHENKALSFLSMMDYALRFNLFPSGIEYVFVDEAQDNGKIQGDYWKRILDMHPEVRGFMLAGDDKQAINGFKGGYAEGFLDFPADISVSLGASHRCPQPILDIANRVAGPITPRSPLVTHSLSPNQGKIIDRSRFTSVIADIREAVIGRRSVLILSRHSFTEGDVRRRLNEGGIPTYRESADTIRRIFRAFSDIKQSGVITSQDYEILAPLRPSKSETPDGALKITCPYFNREMRKEENKKTKLTNSQQSYLFEAEEQTQFPIRLEDAQTVGLTDVFIHAVYTGSGPNPEYFYGGKKVQSIVDDVKYWIKTYGFDYVPVRVSTVHSAKGMEADVVVVLRDISYKQSHRERGEQEYDERRVFYVAVTRSKDVLILTTLGNGMRQTFTTRFL